MAITKAITTAPKSGQPQRVTVLAALCDGCLGHVLDLWACNLSPSPLFRQYSCQCASRTPNKYIINNNLPIEQRTPGCNGEIMHWVKLGGKATATCTPYRTTDKQTSMCKNTPMPVMVCSCKAQASLTTAQCLNALPQCNASMQCLIHQCLNVMASHHQCLIHHCLNAMPHSPLPNASLTNAPMPHSPMPNAQCLTHQCPMPIHKRPMPNASLTKS